MVKLYEINAKRIMHKTKIPGGEWAINHYSGCMHGCIYCYARFVCRYRRQNDRWGEFVDIKVNAPILVAKESRNKKGRVILCTTSDPYQPIEKEYKLTRKVLENLNKNLKLVILTKSDLILRDMDIFKKFKECELGLTITSLDERVRKVFEPFSSSSKKRVEALKKLKEEGFYTYAFIGPILPYLTDIEEMFEVLSPFVDILMFEDLNMNPAKKEILEAVKNNFPDLESKYRNLSKSFWIEKEREIMELSKKYKKPVKIYFKNTGSLRF